VTAHAIYLQVLVLRLSTKFLLPSVGKVSNGALQFYPEEGKHFQSKHPKNSLTKEVKFLTKHLVPRMANRWRKHSRFLLSSSEGWQQRVQACMCDTSSSNRYQQMALIPQTFIFILEFNMVAACTVNPTFFN
jgi:hypothetical protein